MEGLVICKRNIGLSSDYLRNSYANSIKLSPYHMCICSKYVDSLAHGTLGQVIDMSWAIQN